MVFQHIGECLPPSFDTHHLTYKANQSMEDAVTITLHKRLSGEPAELCEDALHGLQLSVQYNHSGQLNQQTAPSTDW